MHFEGGSLCGVSDTECDDGITAVVGFVGFHVETQVAGGDRDVWIQFGTKESFEEASAGLLDLIRDSDGKDEIVIYVKDPKSIRRLGPSRSIQADAALLDALRNVYGTENVKVTERRTPGR